jgi:hypothetical protein
MDLKQLVKEVLAGKDCCTASKPTKAPILNENLAPREILSEGLKYHIDNKKPLTEHLYRAGSTEYFNLWSEARSLYVRGILNFSGDDLDILTETDLGEFTIINGKKTPLDFIFEEIDEELDEAKKSKKKNPPLNKPHRGGSKKFYVYVKDPKTKRIKKVSFGAQGMSAKINNPKARQAFSKRHNCPQKNDKTKASYWSCRLPSYAKLLGLKSNFTGYW